MRRRAEQADFAQAMHAAAHPRHLHVVLDGRAPGTFVCETCSWVSVGNRANFANLPCTPGVCGHGRGHGCQPHGVAGGPLEEDRGRRRSGRSSRRGPWQPGGGCWPTGWAPSCGRRRGDSRAHLLRYIRCSLHCTVALRPLPAWTPPGQGGKEHPNIIYSALWLPIHSMPMAQRAIALSAAENELCGIGTGTGDV